MHDPKKLVRGLRDISPLFGGLPRDEVCEGRPSEVQVIGVSSPDHDNDSLLLNTFFASQVASQNRPCTLLSVLSRQGKVPHGVRDSAPESFGNHLQRHCLYWDELRDLMAAPAAHCSGKALQSRDIFLDFECGNLIHFERILCLLDKWVLLLKPTAESLTEGYKMMKAGLELNPRLSFYVTLSGKPEISRGERVFEKFSDFALQNLDVHLEWLGWIDLADPERHFSSSLHTELLCYQPWDAKPDLQKFMLAEWIESREKQARSPVPMVTR